MKLKSSRGIVMKLICCTALVVLSSAVAFSATPTSGAFLTIDGTAGTTAVHIKLYDSQIHSGVVQAVPTCITADQVPTDAYVLQGGSATGCDPGDAFEVTDDNTSTSKQTFGTVDISGFHIETHYKSQPVVSITGATNNGDGTTTYNYTPARGAGLVANETIVISGMTAGGNNGTFTITAVTGTSFTVSNSSGVNASGENGTGMASVLVCNTSGSICAAPDTGFITVTNGTGSAFTGTISLKGVSPVGGGFCPAGGIASDSSNDLAIGSSVTLALSTDSSNCGGFNQSQRLTLNSNVTASATFGADDYQITPLNATNLLIDVLPVPVPSGFTESITYPTVFNSSLFFDPGTNFSGQKCVAISDFSAVKNPVCVEFQLQCVSAGTCNNVVYTAQADYSIDGSSLPNGIGGPAFLGQHAVSCPTSGFNLNIFQFYQATAVDPLKGGGSGTGSCYVATFDPNATAVGVNQTVTQRTFVGFQLPVKNVPALNGIHAGQSAPLIWQTFDSSGNPVTNLTLCSNTDGTGCTAPWVVVQTVAITCPGGALNTATDLTNADSGKSVLQNFGNGTYQFNLQTKRGSKGCFTPVLTITGFASYGVANFMFN